MALTVKNEDKNLNFFLGDFDIISHLEHHYEVTWGHFAKYFSPSVLLLREGVRHCDGDTGKVEGWEED